MSTLTCNVQFVWLHFMGTDSTKLQAMLRFLNLLMKLFKNLHIKWWLLDWEYVWLWTTQHCKGNSLLKGKHSPSSEELQRHLKY